MVLNVDFNGIKKLGYKFCVQMIELLSQNIFYRNETLIVSGSVDFHTVPGVCWPCLGFNIFYDVAQPCYVLISDLRWGTRWISKVFTVRGYMYIILLNEGQVKDNIEKDT